MGAEKKQHQDDSSPAYPPNGSAWAHWARKRHPWIVLPLLLASVPLMWFVASHVARYWATLRVNEAVQSAQMVLSARQHAVGLEMERELLVLRTMPQLLAGNRVVLATLQAPHPNAVEAANEVLLQAALMQLVDVIWLMDKQGRCIAASNWSTAESLIGQDYSDRSYFTDAIAGRIGHQYAVGRKTNVPGLFYSAPLRDARGRIIGAVAVKSDLATVSRRVSLQGSLLVDDLGVVVMGEKANALGRALVGSAALGLDADTARRRYRQEHFEPLQFSPGAWPEVPAVQRFEERPVISRRVDLPEGGFGLMLLESIPQIPKIHADARLAQALMTALGVTLIWAVVSASFFVARTRAQRSLIEEHNRSLARSNEELGQQLESKVKQRTAALEDEIDVRRKAEEKLLAFQLELSELTQQLLAQEKDLTRGLAQALHDQLGQMLAAARLRLDAMLTVHGAALPEALRAEGERLAKLLDSAMREVRQVLVGLRPPLLYEEGLEQALDNEIRSRVVHGVTAEIRLKVADDAAGARWPADLEYSAFMIGREAIANALQHAHASWIEVRLGGNGASLRLDIVDDGAGIPLPVAEGRPGHLGMVGMRERAVAIGARLTVESLAGGGTHVALRWETPVR